MNMDDIYGFFFRYFRGRRLAQFRRLFPENECRTVIDLGGTRYQWDRLGYGSDITILNVCVPQEMALCPPNYRYVMGDARDTGLPTAAYDLAFSNSVIEHVGDKSDQQRFARELLRLGKRVYCQTPNKWFFVEPHLIVPFLHWLPRKWVGYFLIRYCTIRGLVTKPSREAAADFVNSIRLLDRREVTELFPGCEILTERFLFCPKSFVVVKR